MGALTEREIFDCLGTNLKLAAEHCDDLARLPAQGPTYVKLREELKLAEGCCRQAAYWRQDARWLPMGLTLEVAHQRAGNWLRGKQPRKMFTKLADFLRSAHAACEEIRTARTGKVGMILPKPQYVGRREHGPIQVLMPPKMSPGGIMYPS